MHWTRKERSYGLAVLLAAVAGIIYNSWPLGYWLNPAASKRGLASELEAFHQPYDWLFIVLDVMSGVLIAIVMWLLWHREHDKWRKAVLVNFALFGLFTLLSAVLPMSCEPSLESCPSVWHQPLLILHGITSILASLCLFASAVIMWWLKRKHPTWFIMSILMTGWGLFGLFSLYFLIIPGPGYIAEHYYITLCSVWVVLLPFMVGRVPMSRDPDSAKQK